MNPSEHETWNLLPVNPDCAAVRQALQRRLDGEVIVESREQIAHRDCCSMCRSYEVAARRFEQALRQDIPVLPPPDLAERIVARWLAERPRRAAGPLRYAVAGFVLAASVLVAVLFIQQKQTAPDKTPAVVEKRQAPVPANEVIAEQAAPLTEQINEAEFAVASLTRKTTDDTLNLKLPSLSLSTGNPYERLQPAVDSIQSVGQGAVSSILPITDSARRAADLFWKELAPDFEQKTKVN